MQKTTILGATLALAMVTAAGHDVAANRFARGCRAEMEPASSAIRFPRPAIR